MKPPITTLDAIRILGGFGLLIVGGLLALPGVPGPGIPIILLGLLLLSNHFDWAKRTLAWLKRRTDAIRRTRPEAGGPRRAPDQR